MPPKSSNPDPISDQTADIRPDKILVTISRPIETPLRGCSNSPYFAYRYFKICKVRTNKISSKLKNFQLKKCCPSTPGNAIVLIFYGGPLTRSFSDSPSSRRLTPTGANTQIFIQRLAQ